MRHLTYTYYFLGKTMLNFKRVTALGSIMAIFTLLVGCATNSATAPEASVAPVEKLTIYEVHKDGRIHIFYDKELHKEFMQLGETSYRLTKIAAGPNRETMVFGLTKKDKKLKKPVPAIELYAGKLKQDNIYAEMYKHGRIYVFNSFKDMETVRAFGHPNYMYSQISAGPNRETVVYVLNNKTKKKRPDALIAEFKKHNS